MITVFKKLSAIILTGLITTLQCRAQSEFLSSFTGTQKGSTIYLSFTLKNGITCFGTDIERSADGMNFKTIGTITGICGSNEGETTYSYEDISPLLNQNNHYRLLLGQVGYSETIQVIFFDFTGGPVVFPNPASGLMMIFFPNTSGKFVHFKLYDLAGRLIDEADTTGGSVQLNASNYSHGLYLFSIEDDESLLFQGKLVIQ